MRVSLIATDTGYRHDARLFHVRLNGKLISQPQLPPYSRWDRILVQTADEFTGLVLCFMTDEAGKVVLETAVECLEGLSETQRSLGVPRAPQPRRFRLEGRVEIIRPGAACPA